MKRTEANFEEYRQRARSREDRRKAREEVKANASTTSELPEVAIEPTPGRSRRSHSRPPPKSTPMAVDTIEEVKPMDVDVEA